MSRSRSATAFLLAALAFTLPAAAQTVESLLLQVSLESELLVDSLARYLSARDAERDALARLDVLSSQIDGQIERNDLPIEELRRAERELVEAAEIATARLRQTALARIQVYDQRQRLILLERRLAEAGGGPLVPDSGISGLWQLQMEPGGAFGLMRVQADGTLLSGTYVLSNGEQGSIRGTVIDNEVEIERIDTSQGFVDTLQGDFDAPRGFLRGRWTGNELAPAGRPTTGTWTGRRLARGAPAQPVP